MAIPNLAQRRRCEGPGNPRLFRINVDAYCQRERPVTPKARRPGVHKPRTEARPTRRPQADAVLRGGGAVRQPADAAVVAHPLPIALSAQKRKIPHRALTLLSNVTFGRAFSALASSNPAVRQRILRSAFRSAHERAAPGAFSARQTVRGPRPNELDHAATSMTLAWTRSDWRNALVLAAFARPSPPGRLRDDGQSGWPPHGTHPAPSHKRRAGS